MIRFFTASMQVMLFLCISLARADESIASNASKETALPSLPDNEKLAVTLEEAIKKVMQNTNNKLLAAKTEMLDGKKIHLLKVLTASGHIQYIKIDAATGIPLDKPGK